MSDGGDVEAVKERWRMHKIVKADKWGVGSTMQKYIQKKLLVYASYFLNLAGLLRESV